MEEMKKVKGIYVKLLLCAVIIFAVGAAFILSDLYSKVGDLEHDMMHLKGVKKSPVCNR